MLVWRIYCSSYTAYRYKGDTFRKASENYIGVHSRLEIRERKQ